MSEIDYTYKNNKVKKLIEAKRKEIEEAIHQVIDSEIPIYSIEECYTEKLEGFNLGVEMARKEFLNKIDNLVNEFADWTNPKDAVNMLSVRLFADALKQSLEEKK